MVRIVSVLLCFVLCLLPLAGLAEEAADAAPVTPVYSSVPHVIRPGKTYDIVLQAEQAGTLTLNLLSQAGAVVYTLYSGYPVGEGNNVLHWDGLKTDDTAVEPGDYVLRADLGGVWKDAEVRIGAPYPMLTRLRQSSDPASESLIIEFESTDAGQVDISLQRYLDQTITPMGYIEVSVGANTYTWNRQINGTQVLDGDYALILTLRPQSDLEAYPCSVRFTLSSKAQPTPSASETSTADIDSPQSDPTPYASAEPVQRVVPYAPDVTPEPSPTPEPTPEPTPVPTNAPYSSLNDGSFWSLTPGETDPAALWNVLMQPITVYDGGLDARDHIYLRENPDGSGEKLAQIHAQSQGVHVIGETNEHGYVLVEAFSSYDDKYTPKTDEAKAAAFEVKQGYILAKNLKTIEVQQDIAFIIDKLTQRMYMYKDGQLETEFVISTGIIADGKYYYETTSGEFITVSHTGGFGDDYMYCDMAIRINGGILIHEVPHQINRDGTKNYRSFESKLGEKASHGCVRVQRQKNDDGYNHRWLWENLGKGRPYKVVVWEDLNRYDTPAASSTSAPD